MVSGFAVGFTLKAPPVGVIVTSSESVQPLASVTISVYVCATVKATVVGFCIVALPLIIAGGPQFQL